jgi:MoaA/NifB/PqqE/SkfB family radical SAM enzyme
MNSYSTMKAAWHLDRVEDLRKGSNTIPVSLQLILSDYCNHDCHFCAYRASAGFSTERFADAEGNKNPNRMMDADKAKEILKDASDAGVKSVIFTGGGEPTVHPKHLELFEYAWDLGLDCALNTNGVTFRKDWERILPVFSYVRFSIDAGTADEYMRIRSCPKSHYERALGNMKMLREEVDKSGTACVVGAGYVVTPENYVNLHEGVLRIRDSGAHYVRLAAMQSTEDKSAYGRSWDVARDEARTCAELTTPEFTVYDLMDGVMGERPDYEFCGFQHFVTYIGANLEIYRCCYTAYTNLGLVGSLENQTLAEYLGTNRLDGFDARDCRVCPLNTKNKVINAAIEPDPIHVNFV